MFKEFRTFIMRGNVVDLAVAFVFGAAFSAVVTALVKDLITPIITAFAGKAAFSSLYFTVHNSKFLYGDFINSVVSFLLVAFVVFYFVVQPVNKFKTMAARRKTPEDPTDRICPECLSTVPKAASRCMYCTSKIAPAKP